MVTLLRFSKTWARILVTTLAMMCLYAFSPAFGQDNQSGGDTLFIRAYDSNLGTRTFRILVANRQSVPHSDLEFIEAHIIGEGYRVPWGTIPPLPYYVACPNHIYWMPCPPFDDAIYLSCVVDAENRSPIGRASGSAQLLCLSRATNPSFADRLRYR